VLHLGEGVKLPSTYGSTNNWTALHVQITGFSPLGSSSYVSLGMDGGEGVGVLSNPVVQELASKYGKTPAQVVLR
jgi:diketogulonate reductase-like aldo/keto reductase